MTIILEICELGQKGGASRPWDLRVEYWDVRNDSAAADDRSAGISGFGGLSQLDALLCLCAVLLPVRIRITVSLD